MCAGGEGGDDCELSSGVKIGLMGLGAERRSDGGGLTVWATLNEVELVGMH